jgi:reductive dehalogenase
VQLLPFALSSLGLVLTATLAICAIVSLREGERRAAVVFSSSAAAVGGPLIAAPLLPAALQILLATVALATAVALGSRCALPLRRRRQAGGEPSQRVDERDIMFARGRLRPGSATFETYYSMRPENRIGDDKTRALPGLLSPDAELAEPVSFAAADACFQVTESLRDSVNGAVSPHRYERSSAAWTSTIKDLALAWGAVDVGIAALKPEYVYSHVGRGTGAWGAEIDLPHKWAIAFTVEMEHQAVAHAPSAPVVAESARQYVESAKIAVQLAALIRNLGWPARAHIDGNYRLIAPLVARAAGLGEIGRMGLLMTPRLGPRVRLGVVTTDLPLIADPPGDDVAVLDFCLICSKCADNCPVGAIPRGDRIEMKQGRRWIIDDETCYRYWNAIGTDCATCMKVCPYSHPNNAMHNIVRTAIRLSPGTRNLMLWADDFVYGRRP